MTPSSRVTFKHLNKSSGINYGKNVQSTAEAPVTVGELTLETVAEGVKAVVCEHHHLLVSLSSVGKEI